jgi:hypothetical protein
MSLATTKPADNAVADYSHAAPRYTDAPVDDRSPARSPFLPIAPPKTAATANRPQTSLPTAHAYTVGGNAAVPQHIDGVIAGIHRETVVIQCHLPGQVVEITLPPALIPSELQAYGQTVSVSLDYSSGYQRPLVQRRAPSPRDLLPGEEAVDAWIDTL